MKAVLKINQTAAYSELVACNTAALRAEVQTLIAEEGNLGNNFWGKWSVVSFLQSFDNALPIDARKATNKVIADLQLPISAIAGRDCSSFAFEHWVKTHCSVNTAGGTQALRVGNYVLFEGSRHAFGEWLPALKQLGKEGGVEVVHCESEGDADMLPWETYLEFVSRRDGTSLSLLTEINSHLLYVDTCGNKPTEAYPSRSKWAAKETGRRSASFSKLSRLAQLEYAEGLLAGEMMAGEVLTLAARLLIAGTTTEEAISQGLVRGLMWGWERSSYNPDLLLFMATEQSPIEVSPWGNQALAFRPKQEAALPKQESAKTVESFRWERHYAAAYLLARMFPREGSRHTSVARLVDSWEARVSVKEGL